jgi:hypothetical protein
MSAITRLFYFTNFVSLAQHLGLLVHGLFHISSPIRRIHHKVGNALPTLYTNHSMECRTMEYRPAGSASSASRGINSVQVGGADKIAQRGEISHH